MRNLENSGDIEKSILDKIKDCLQDYSNDFVAIDITLKGGGISRVHKLIKDGYKVSTVEEYLKKYRDENRETISLEDQKNSLFIKKAKELNELANQINSLGAKIDEQQIKKIMGQVAEITHFKTK